MPAFRFPVMCNSAINNSPSQYVPLFGAMLSVCLVVFSPLIVYGNAQADKKINSPADTIPGVKADLRIHLKHDVYTPAPPVCGVTVYITIESPYVYDTLAVSDSTGTALFAHIPLGHKYHLISSTRNPAYLLTEGTISFQDTQDIDVILIPDTATFCIDGMVTERIWEYSPHAADTIITRPCAACSVRIADMMATAGGVTDSTGTFRIAGLPMQSFSPSLTMAVPDLAMDFLSGWPNLDTGTAFPSKSFQYGNLQNRQLLIRNGLHTIVFAGQPRFIPRDSIIAGRIKMLAATEKSIYPRPKALITRVWVVNVPADRDPVSYVPDSIICANDAGLVHVEISDSLGNHYQYQPHPFAVYDNNADGFWPCSPPAIDTPVIRAGTMGILTSRYRVNDVPVIQFQPIMYVTMALQGISGVSTTFPIRVTDGQAPVAGKPRQVGNVPLVRIITSRRAIVIMNGEGTNIEVAVTDPAGRSLRGMREKRINSAGMTCISLPSISCGMYLIRIRSDRGYSFIQRVLMP